MPRYIKYIRRSRADSDADAETSFDRQNATIERWNERHPDYRCIGTYKEVASAGTDQRDQWQQVVAQMDDLAPGDALVAESQSRFMRETVLMILLAEECHERDIQLIMADFDEVVPDPMSDPRGWRNFQEQAVDDEYERRRTSYRIRRTFEQMRTRGKYLGSTPVGTRRRDDGTLEADPRTIAGVRRAYELYADKVPMSEAAAILEEEGHRGTWDNDNPHWTRKRIRYAVQAWRTYAGHLITGDAIDDYDNVRILMRNAWDPILPLDLIHRARDVYEARKFGTVAPAAKYLLSGILRCMRCGAKLYGQHQRPSATVSREYYRYIHTESVDHLASADCEPVEAAVFDAVERLDFSVAAQVAEAYVRRRQREEAHGRDVATIRAEIADREEQVRRLLRLYAKGNMPEELLDEEVAQLRAEIDDLREQLTVDHEPEVSPDELIATLETAAQRVRYLDQQRQRDLLVMLFDRIDVNLDTLTVCCVLRERFREYFGDMVYNTTE